MSMEPLGRHFSRALIVFREIQPEANYVELNGVRVPRPSHVTPEEWRDFWAEVRYLNGC
jgi:hypothetical protein